VSSKELLIVFVVNVLNYDQTSERINYNIGLRRVVIEGLRKSPCKSYHMVHLQEVQLLLRLLLLLLLILLLLRILGVMRTLGLVRSCGFHYFEMFQILNFYSNRV